MCIVVSFNRGCFQMLRAAFGTECAISINLTFQGSVHRVEERGNDLDLYRLYACL